MRPVRPRVVDHLNDALTLELSVINTYFLHARMLDSWGFPKLGKVFYDLSIDEMRDADALITRILFFEGHPNMQRLALARRRRGRRGDAAPGARGRDRRRRAVQRRRQECHALGDHGTALAVRGDGPRRGEARRLVRGPDRGDHAIGLPQYLAQQVETSRPPDRERVAAFGCATPCGCRTTAPRGAPPPW